MGTISANLVDRLGSLPAPVSARDLDDPSALGEALDALGYLAGGNVYDATAVSEATARLKADYGYDGDDVVDPALVVHLITLVTTGITTGELQPVENMERVDPAEMVELDFPPQAVDGGVDLDDRESALHLIDKVYDDVQDRLQDWALKVMNAVSQFKDKAELRIDNDALFDNNGDADVVFLGVMMDFADAVVSHMPGAGPVWSAVHQGYDLLGTLRQYFGDKPLGVAGARQRLRTAVTQLHLAANQTLDELTTRYQRQPGQTVWDSPLGQAVWDALTWVDSASTDPDYVAALCDWVMPAPTTENTTNPIRDALENSFNDVYSAVSHQLLREQGYDLNTY